MRASRSARRLLTITAIALLGAALVAAPADAKAPSTQHNTGRYLADPGIAYLKGAFRIYGTGGGFPVSSSKAWNGPYSTPHRTLSAAPRGVTTCGKFGTAEWAPQVFAVGKTYVMYFSSCTKSSPNRPCLGVATSASPTSNFRPVSGPWCAPASAGRGAEAIDPSQYSAGGHRYLLFKTSVGNRSGWTIWAWPMNAAGTKRAGAVRVVHRFPAIAEAPFAVNHGGKVWLFVSRDWFNTCSYHTDVYKAGSLFAGYTRVGSLITQKSSGVCGPGGLSIVTVGSNYYAAYHGWAEATPSSGKRKAFVARLGWHRSGTPYLI